MGNLNIGKHLTSLNLFREPDGTVEITVAGGGAVMQEWDGLSDKLKQQFETPHRYIEFLIISAAKRMAERLSKD